ncbi:MAG: hypothetical protein WBC55_00770 [Dehalococcoidia bacterium]
MNRRLAMLSIDNAVELMIKTYLGLPRRVTGINLSRRKYLEISESFPQLLDTLEQHAVDKLDGIDLGEIEWYHRVRNELYHQGNGLTVERDKVEVYAELAKLLFGNLFGFDLQIKEGEGTDILGAFMAAWVTFEQVAGALITKLGHPEVTLRRISTLLAGRELAAQGLIDRSTAQEIEQLRMIRNQVVHGVGDYKAILRPEMVERVKAITQQLEQRLSEID